MTSIPASQFPLVNSRETIAIGSALPMVCLVIVTLRLQARKLQKVDIGIDDWLAVAGSVGSFQSL